MSIKRVIGWWIMCLLRVDVGWYLVVVNMSLVLGLICVGRSAQTKWTSKGLWGCLVGSHE